MVPKARAAVSSVHGFPKGSVHCLGLGALGAEADDVEETGALSPTSRARVVTRAPSSATAEKVVVGEKEKVGKEFLC